jgi:RNA recognition motif-containing protein
MNIYVGNIAHAVSEEELRQAFEVFGEVAEVRLITDKFSGKPKGFGFIEMPSKEEAEKAIEEMNGKDLKERPITVNEAKPKTDRNSRGRGGSGGGGYGGNRRGSGGSRGGGGRY